MINIFDCKENNSCISKNRLIKDSEFLKYEIIYPKIVLNQKYIDHNNYNKYIIQNINDMMYRDTIKHKESIEKQATEYAKNYNNSKFKYKYQLYIDFKLGYDKNDLISIPTEKHIFMGKTYDIAYLISYNYDLKTGQSIELKDLFRKNVDYKSIINDHILKEIKKNNEVFFMEDSGFKGINEKQNFYINKDSIIIYFEIYEIAPYNVVIPIFKINFQEIKKYLNSKYVCI